MAEGSLNLKKEMADRFYSDYNYTTEKRNKKRIIAKEKVNENERKIVTDPFIAWKRGKPMNVDVKMTILNVFVRLQMENPSMTTEDLTTACSDLTGVNAHTVAMLRTEYHENGRFTTPQKKRRSKNTGISRLNVKCNNSTVCAVREIMYNIFRRGEMPTLNKILTIIEGDPSVDLPIMEMSTLDRVIKDIGFVYLRPRNRCRPNSFLVEKDDIVLWRRKYLRDIRHIRSNNSKIYYVDETSIDVDLKKRNIQPDSTVENRNATFPSESLELESECPAETCSRVVVMHAGSADGFVTGAANVFLSEKGGELMDGSFFESWFGEKVMPNLQPNSVIVMDNTWYHSLKVEPLPTVFWQKREIEKWLTEKNVTWDSEQLKPELLQLAETTAKQYSAYRVDKIAERHDHKVLCLPPLHGDLNPMEEAWLLVNKHLAASKKVVDVPEAKRLIETAISMITPKQWATFESKVIAKETEMWDMAAVIEDMIDSALLSNLGYLSSDSNDEGPYFEEELMMDVCEEDQIDLDESI